MTKNIVCPQGKHPYLNLTGYEEREDCLVANVYMPDTNEKNLQVLVYVHGGGYVIGFGETMVPTALVRTKKVVAVTFNYRLGAHGFLCLGTEGAPGNAGMKDQVALLRWVQKNIANFGGNPGDVTIGGFSAGSSAVDLLMLSDMTKGLYNKAIPESGASVGVWSVQIDPVQNAKDFAKQLKFDNVDNITALEEFYSNLSYDDLTSDAFFDRIDSTFVFTPCVESEASVEKFLVDAPVNILAQGKNRKVPVLYGFANMEGLFRIGTFLEWKNGMNERFSDFLPPDLQFKDDKEKEEVAQKIKRFYFGDDIVSEATMQGYIDYFSDIMFAYPHLRSVKLQIEGGSDSIYLYEFSYYKPYPDNIGLPEFMRNVHGAGHCAQSTVVHESNKFLGFPDNSEDFKIVKTIMIELWLNFITTG